MAAFRVKYNEWLERLPEKMNKGGPLFDIYRVGEKCSILSICLLLDPFVVNILKEEMSLSPRDQRFQQVVIRYAFKYIERGIRNKTLPIEPSENTHFESIKEKHLPEIRQLILENTYHSDSNSLERIIKMDQENLSAPQSRVVRIFLCHASEDKPQVLEVYQKLKALGFAPWIDKKEILGGQDWNYEIEQALEASDFVIVFLSTRSVNKMGYVQREFKRALQYAEDMPEGFIHTIPIKLNDCAVPRQFRRYQWINLYEDGAFEQIIRALHHGLQQRGKPVPEPSPTESSHDHENIYPEAETLSFLPRPEPDILNDRQRERTGEKFTVIHNNHPPHPYTRQEADRLTSTQREKLFAADPEMKNWWRGKSMTNGAWSLFRIQGGTWISKGQIEQVYEQTSEEQRDAIWKIPGLLDWYMDGLKF